MKIIIFSIVCLILITCSPTSNEEEYSPIYINAEIRGKVTDSADKSPIEAVRVILTVLYGPEAYKGYEDWFQIIETVYTDKEGRYAVHYEGEMDPNYDQFSLGFEKQGYRWFYYYDLAVKSGVQIYNCTLTKTSGVLN